MRRLLALIVLPLLVVPALAACSFARGPEVSQDRPVEDVLAVVLATSGDLIITVGEPALTITASSTVIDQLTSEVQGGVLRLGQSGPFGIFRGNVRYELSLPALDSVTISGSGDVVADLSGASDVSVLIEGSGDIVGSGIDADTVVVAIEGSGDIELSGVTDGLEVTIDGSGDIELEDLVARDARASISGSGSIRVHATATLDAEVRGSGTISYSGGATVSSTISGSGSIVAD